MMREVVILTGTPSPFVSVVLQTQLDDFTPSVELIFDAASSSVWAFSCRWSSVWKLSRIVKNDTPSRSDKTIPALPVLPDGFLTVVTVKK